MRKKRPAIDRFMEKVEKLEDGCWRWTAFIDKSTGYGQFFNGVKDDGAHRFSYEYFVGPREDALYVLHKCDNKWCVNPEHLYLGTAKENAKDAVERGQFPFGDRHGSKTHPERVCRGEESSLKHRGELNGAAKLTEEQVKEIRRLWFDQHIKQPEIAIRFSMSLIQINRIINRKKWKHVP